MLNPGKYRGRPVSAALGLTSTNKEQIAVTFELVDPPGERITWYGFFTEKTTDRTLQSLRHCGWHGTDLAVFCEEQLPAGFDQEVELDVQHEEYPANSGKFQARVAWVNGGGGLAVKNAMTRDQAKSFADRMQRTIVALDKEAGRTAAAARPAPRPTPAPAARPAASAAPSGPPEPDEATRAALLEQQAQTEDVPY